MEVFDRLVGLETEYAVRYPEHQAGTQRPAFSTMFQALLGALRKRVPTAEVRHPLKIGLFMANGGAVWSESAGVSAASGLVEGAIPECRGPRQVTLYQRAQDRLLGDAAQAAFEGTPFFLVKNDRDSQGNAYGAQENYEAVVASGVGLWCYRLGLVLLAPAGVFVWLAFLLIIILCLAAMFGVLIVQAFRGALTQKPVAAVNELPWLDSLILWLVRIFLVPLAIPMWFFAWLLPFRRTRIALTPFLASRSIFCGAGMLDEPDHFHLADKAGAINCVVGFGGLIFDRPLFSFGHFFKAICFDIFLVPRHYFDLFRARQRLQINLGDSNMAEWAEYLRVGTTLLVLDAFEAGKLNPPFRLPRALGALHRISRDSTLKTKVRLTGGREWTALEIQRWYWEACHDFLRSTPGVPREAWHVLEMWLDVLHALENQPETLFGKVDWITKQRLLVEAGTDAPWEARKKIDLRYHELSSGGYFQRLQLAGILPEIHTPEAIEQATRTPPSDSPAAVRGRYIREYADSSESLRVGWHHLILGRGRASRTILLTRFRRLRETPPDTATTLSDE